MSLQENIRTTLRGVVATLATSQAVLEYARDVPGVPVIAELYCQWFDDVYHPDSAEFRHAFSPEALVALEELNRRLDAVGDAVEGLAVVDVIAAPWWKPVQAAAQRALTSLQP